MATKKSRSLINIHNGLRSSNVWKDGDILCEALAPCCKNGKILTIASAGDNVLALLTIDPKEIVACDINSAELACLELKISAFRHLDYFGLLSFLGITSANNRHETYQELRGDLSQNAQSYWDNNPTGIEEGIIHAGRFEYYLKIFRNYLLPLIHSKQTRDALFIPRSYPDRLQFYTNTWDSFLWRLLFRLFFNRWIIGKDERESESLNYVQGDASNRLLRRTKHALTELSTHSNPYLNYIIKGNYNLEALPRYLRAEFKESITSRLERIKIIHATIEDAVKDEHFNGFNLSGIFESMSQEDYQRCYTTLLKHAYPKSRFVYWDTLHPHPLIHELDPYINTQPALSEVLHLRDKAWLYQTLHVDEIKKQLAP